MSVMEVRLGYFWLAGDFQQKFETDCRPKPKDQIHLMRVMMQLASHSSMFWPCVLQRHLRLQYACLPVVSQDYKRRRTSATPGPAIKVGCSGLGCAKAEIEHRMSVLMSCLGDSQTARKEECR